MVCCPENEPEFLYVFPSLRMRVGPLSPEEPAVNRRKKGRLVEEDYFTFK